MFFYWGCDKQEANVDKRGWHESDDIFYLARLQLVDSADRTSDKWDQGQGFNFCELKFVSKPV